MNYLQALDLKQSICELSHSIRETFPVPVGCHIVELIFPVRRPDLDPHGLIGFWVAFPYEVDSPLPSRGIASAIHLTELTYAEAKQELERSYRNLLSFCEELFKG